MPTGPSILYEFWRNGPKWLNSKFITKENPPISLLPSVIGGNGGYKRTSDCELHRYGLKLHVDSIGVLTYDLNDRLLLACTP